MTSKTRSGLISLASAATPWRGVGSVPDNRYAMDALERHKRQGMELAVQARIIAMSVIALMMFFIVPAPGFLYYQAIALLFILIGLAQRRVGRVGRSWQEVALAIADVILMTIVMVFPNPLNPEPWPTPAQYAGNGFIYYFIILAVATLSYSWRTIVAFGTWVTVLWSAGVLMIWALDVSDPALHAQVQAIYAGWPRISYLMDPTQMQWDVRFQEIVVFFIVAATLGVTVRRFGSLMLAHAASERERANLARYFSPNVVEQLSHNDDPLKEVRTQDIAVLFVDIVGFTTYSADRDPQEVIATLRDFHARMEAEVFRHNGTLDKYLGDGLMATFGTPFAGEHDAGNALRCARAMIGAVEQLNTERRARGEPEIRASFGLHYGPAVLGDIGANRLEFAVIGNTVNVASRLEALSRPLGAKMVASDDLITRLQAENAANGLDPPLGDLHSHQNQTIRGLSQPIKVWTLD